MYEHKWHWKRALLAVLVGPLGASAAVGLLYWVLSNLIVMLVGGDLDRSDLSLITDFFVDGETIVFMSLGTGLIGAGLMLVLGIPIGYGLSKLTRYSKAAYVAASSLAFLGMVATLMFENGPSVPTTGRDIYFLSYFALITLLNGWIAHWVIHGKRKRPPERVEAVFE